MRDVIIENPILNSPYREPSRHFMFDDDGITDRVADGRRSSTYFVPVPQPKKKGKQLVLDSQWTEGRMKPNDFINDVRQRVSIWRGAGYPGITAVTRRLLEHWKSQNLERRLFFCHIEALETAVYIAEYVPKSSDHWVTQKLKDLNANSGWTLYRIAFKIATGSGKTTVMAMLVAWNVLNKIADRGDKRFSDCFLFVMPGITIRDRLRVLLPSDPGNYYRAFDIVPADLRGDGTVHSRESVSASGAGCGRRAAGVGGRGREVGCRRAVRKYGRREPAEGRGAEHVQE